MVIRPAGEQADRRCKKGNPRTVAPPPGQEEGTEKMCGQEAKARGD